MDVLSSTFPEILDQGGFSDPDFYRATIKDAGTVTLAGMSGTQYDITVCWKDGKRESCLAGTTVGPSSASKAIVN